MTDPKHIPPSAPHLTIEQMMKLGTAAIEAEAMNDASIYGVGAAIVAALDRLTAELREARQLTCDGVAGLYYCKRRHGHSGDCA